MPEDNLYKELANKIYGYIPKNLETEQRRIMKRWRELGLIPGADSHDEWRELNDEPS